MGKTLNSKKADKMTYIIIALLFLLLVSALIFAFTSGISFSSTSSYTLDVNQKKTKDDGETYRNVTATYNVEVNSNKVSKKDVESVIYETMDKFSYEDITGEDALQNLKDQAKKNLERQFGEENVDNIYISDFNANSSNTNYGITSSESHKQRNKIMGGLFPNMN